MPSRPVRSNANLPRRCHKIVFLSTYKIRKEFGTALFAGKPNMTILIPEDTPKKPKLQTIAGMLLVSILKWDKNWIIIID